MLHPDDAVTVGVTRREIGHDMLCLSGTLRLGKNRLLCQVGRTDQQARILLPRSNLSFNISASSLP
jgi:hypothetical protein